MSAEKKICSESIDLISLLLMGSHLINNSPLILNPAIPSNKPTALNPHKLESATLHVHITGVEEFPDIRFTPLVGKASVFQYEAQPPKPQCPTIGIRRPRSHPKLLHTGLPTPIQNKQRVSNPRALCVLSRGQKCCSKSIHNTHNPDRLSRFVKLSVPPQHHQGDTDRLRRQKKSRSMPISNTCPQEPGSCEKTSIRLPELCNQKVHHKYPTSSPVCLVPHFKNFMVKLNYKTDKENRRPLLINR